jgi:hypothetical protein
MAYVESMKKKYFYLIDRGPVTDGGRAALVTIKEIDFVGPYDVRPGRTVAEYETSSAGATRSAKRHIRKLEKEAAE